MFYLTTPSTCFMIIFVKGHSEREREREGGGGGGTAAAT